MAYDSKHFCKTPRCMEYIEKYGSNYHYVYDNKNWMPEEYIAKCDGCGGHLDKDLNWIHKCKTCGKTVNPGELVGLFVPHNCEDCQIKIIEEDKRTGNICRLCGSPRSVCCC